MKHLLSILLAVVWCNAPCQSAPRNAPVWVTEPAITAADLRQRLYLIADDSLMGRETGSLGAFKASAYVAAEFRRLGLEPIDAKRFQSVAEEVRRETGAKGRDLYHPMRVALTGASSGPEMVKLLPVIEEGSRLPLPRRVASCVERATSLLSATRGEGV